MPRQAFFFIISCKTRGYPTLISPRAIFCLPEPPSYLPKPPLSPQAPLLSPRALFFVAPSEARGLPLGRRPERSEGCLAIARRVGDEMLRFAQHVRMEGHDRMEDVAPSSLSLSPQGVSRGVPRRLRASG